MKLSSATLARARSKVGVREHGRNAGPDVEEFLRAVHLGPGFSWCAAFVSWCVSHGAADAGVPCGLPLRAAVHRLWDDCPPWMRRSRPSVGAVFCYDRGNGQGHTGLITGVTGTHVTTIEGNTNSAGSAEGDGVYEKMRRWDNGEIDGHPLLGFIVYDSEDAELFSEEATAPLSVA